MSIYVCVRCTESFVAHTSGPHRYCDLCRAPGIRERRAAYKRNRRAEGPRGLIALAAAVIQDCDGPAIERSCGECAVREMCPMAIQAA